MRETLVSGHDGGEHSLPSVGAVNIAGSQRATFQIAELVEHKRWVIAGAFVMAVRDAHLLLAVSGANTRIHVEHDASRRATAMHTVDPLTGKISERREVPFRRQPSDLEAPHLARRCRRARSRFAAHDPAHRRIMTQTFVVVDVSEPCIGSGTVLPGLEPTIFAILTFAAVAAILSHWRSVAAAPPTD
jgi:hypothetical protein